jgi:hypothetical protein
LRLDYREGCIHFFPAFLVAPQVPALLGLIRHYPTRLDMFRKGETRQEKTLAERSDPTNPAEAVERAVARHRRRGGERGGLPAGPGPGTLTCTVFWPGPQPGPVTRELGLSRNAVRRLAKAATPPSSGPNSATADTLAARPASASTSHASAEPPSRSRSQN